MKNDRTAPEEWPRWEEAQLDEQLTAALLRKAFWHQAAEEAARILSEPLPQEVEAMCESSIPRVERKIRRETRGRARPGRSGRVLLRTAQAAAACIAILSLGTVAALAASDAARVQVLRYLVEIGDVSTELSMEPTGVTLDVPEGYEGKYFPSYIPEGFELAQVFDSAFQYCTQDGGRFLTYQEFSPDARVSLDTEGAAISYMECFGTRVMIAEKNGNVTCNWAFDDGFYLLDLDGSRDETIRILKSLTKNLRQK